MSQLTISIDGHNLGEIPLNKERVTIGRHPDNDIVLKDDRAVSGHHAVIISIMDDSFLEDLESTNGTMVNGRRVGKHPLSNGDQIQVGRHVLTFAGAETDYDDDFEKTMILKPSEIIAATSAASKPKAPEAAAPTAAPSTAAPPRPQMGKVVVASGPNSGKELKLTKALTTLGKPGVQVAAITRRADAFFIVHVSPKGGENRPKVNGTMIAAQAQQLNPGDMVEIAGTAMRFELYSPEA